MKTFVYKLSPRSSFHIGEKGIGIEETAEIIHSDTLFSAIASAWRSMGEDMDEKGNLKLLNPFVSDQPPFKLSSAFPFAGDVLLFPAPMMRLGDTKEFKKVKFVSKEILLKDKIDDSVSIRNGKIMVTCDEGKSMPEKLWEQDVAPRVSIDRISSASAIYHCGRLMFAESCGLYFLAQINDEKYKAYLDRAIDFLGDNGIGGERTTGHGQFTYKKEEANLPELQNAKSYMTLSLYHPKKCEVESGVLDNARYDLINRRGWINSPDGSSHRRRSVMMLSEGSLFSKPVDGDVIDVKPIKDWEHHPIYRYGIAFNLPVSWEVKKDG
jgi:CRISPR-associated protein Csm4